MKFIPGGAMVITYTRLKTFAICSGHPRTFVGMLLHASMYFLNVITARLNSVCT